MKTMFTESGALFGGDEQFETPTPILQGTASIIRHASHTGCATQVPMYTSKVEAAQGFQFANTSLLSIVDRLARIPFDVPL